MTATAKPTHKLWIDIPQGYLHGFPKVYDSTIHGTLEEFLQSEGVASDISWIRSWMYYEEESNELSHTER